MGWTVDAHEEGVCGRIQLFFFAICSTLLTRIAICEAGYDQGSGLRGRVIRNVSEAV